LNTGEIDSIEYENLVGGDYAFSVNFSYEKRQDERRSFIGGFEDERSVRCTLITNSSKFPKKSKLREIRFEYDDTNGYSRLSRITETAFSDAEQK
jgi:hypothetical protein